MSVWVRICPRCGDRTTSDHTLPGFTLVAPGEPDPPPGGTRCCEKCPPVECDDCHEPDDRYCSCWESFADMSFADVKATFAAMGLSVDLPRTEG